MEAKTGNVIENTPGVAPEFDIGYAHTLMDQVNDAATTELSYNAFILLLQYFLQIPDVLHNNPSLAYTVRQKLKTVEPIANDLVMRDELPFEVGSTAVQLALQVLELTAEFAPFDCEDPEEITPRPAAPTVALPDAILTKRSPPTPQPDVILTKRSPPPVQFEVTPVNQTPALKSQAVQLMEALARQELAREDSTSDDEALEDLAREDSTSDDDALEDLAQHADALSDYIEAMDALDAMRLQTANTGTAKEDKREMNEEPAEDLFGYVEAMNVKW